MASALSSVGGPPPAPNPTPQATQPSPFAQAATPMAPGAPGSPSNPPQQQKQITPPSHAQTVAALRHFTAIENETRKLLKNPDCGKSDIRSAIIDSVTRLVAKGISTPADAVKELGNVPDKPFEQKQWLQNHFIQAAQAQTAILALHQAGGAGQQPDHSFPSMDDHQTIMNGLGSQLRGSSNG